MRIKVQARFEPGTRFGEMGVGLSLALAKAGHDVVVEPVSLAAGLPRKFIDMLAAPKGGAPVDVNVAVGEPWLLGPRMRDTDARVNVAWTGLDTGGLDRSRLAAFEEGESWFDWFSLVLVTDQESMRGLSVIDDTGRYQLLEAGFDPVQYPLGRRARPRGPLRFLGVVPRGDRVSADSMMTAFDVVARDDDRLVILDDNMTGEIRHGNVALVGMTRDAQDLQMLFAQATGMLSTGMDAFHAVRFAATGGVVAAPRKGEHSSWLDRDTGLDLIPAAAGVGAEQHWVLTHNVAVSAMARLRDEPLVEHGHRAGQMLHASRTWEFVARRFVMLTSRVV